MSRARSRFSLAAVLLASVGAPAGGQAPQAVQRAIRIDADASIRILNLVGSIRVSGWDRDTLAITGRLAPGAGKFYFGGGGRGAKLGVDGGEELDPTQRSDLEVKVPSRAKLWIKGASADIEVVDFRGGLDIYSVSGSIVVKGAPAQVYAESMDGTVTIAAATPFARVKTASGNVSLTGSAEDVAITSVGGSITVRDGGFQRARFESVTGDITFDGPIPQGSSLTTESHSGRITIQVPRDADAGFIVNSFQGKIVNELSTVRPRMERTRGGQELAFDLASGGADVTIRNFRGDVVLKRQK